MIETLASLSHFQRLVERNGLDDILWTVSLVGKSSHVHLSLLVCYVGDRSYLCGRAFDEYNVIDERLLQYTFIFWHLELNGNVGTF